MPVTFPRVGPLSWYRSFRWYVVRLLFHPSSLGSSQFVAMAKIGSKLSAQCVYTAPFIDEDADLIVRSSDDMLFRAYKVLLKGLANICGYVSVAVGQQD